MYFPAALSAETENTDLEDGGMNDRREGEKRRKRRRGGTVSEKAQPPARRLLGSEYGKAGVG